MRKGICSIALAMLLASTTAAMAQQFDRKAYDDLVDANSPETIPPGTQITVHNWTKYKRFMMTWMQLAFSGKVHFHIADSPDYTVNVEPTGDYVIPKAAREDTEKYEGQTRLVPDPETGGYSWQGYRAGIPFPNPQEPNKAEKIMYNIWAGAYIKLAGTTLKGTVVLRVPAPRPGGHGFSAGPNTALLAYYDYAAHRWQAVSASYDPVSHLLTAKSTHLSVWSVIEVNAAALMASLNGALRSFFGVANAAQPSCPNSAQLAALRVKVVSSPGDLVKWCADAAGAGAVVRVANNRGYAMEADYPSTWSMRRAGHLDPVAAVILKWLPALSLKVSGPNVRTVIIPSGQQINVTPALGISARMLISPSVEGIIVDALQYAASTLVMTYGDIPWVPKPNPATTAKALALTLNDPGCVAEMAAVVQNPDVSTPQAAGAVFRSLTDIALGCLADRWAKAYAVPQLSLGAFMASFLLWAVDGVKLILQDSQALEDSALYWQGYHIDVLSSPAPSPSPSPTSPAPKPTPSNSVTVTVSATQYWQPTGIYLARGQQYSVRYVSGSWTVGPNLPYVGPGGYSNQVDATIKNQECKFDGNVNYGVLFAKVGSAFLDETDAIPIGTGGTFRADTPGSNKKQLYMMINGICLANNAGSVTMQVTIP